MKWVVSKLQKTYSKVIVFSSMHWFNAQLEETQSGNEICKVILDWDKPVFAESA